MWTRAVNRQPDNRAGNVHRRAPEYLEINKGFENLPGQKMSRLFKTGERTYCYIGIWESEEAIAAQRNAMIANLDKMRHVLEELSPELGVTDPVSGTVVLDYDG